MTRRRIVPLYRFANRSNLPSIMSIGLPSCWHLQERGTLHTAGFKKLSLLRAKDVGPTRRACSPWRAFVVGYRPEGLEFVRMSPTQGGCYRKFDCWTSYVEARCLCGEPLGCKFSIREIWCESAANSPWRNVELARPPCDPRT